MKACSKNGVICTPHPSATEAGLNILNAGGTAIDAALAASAVLAVVYPHMTGLGGDALWMLSDGRRVDTILGIGQAGQTLPEGGRITARGPASAATTAGALRSWAMALSWSRQHWGSRLNWPDLLEQAIAIARKGSEVSASQAFWQLQRRDLIASLPDLTRLCCDSAGRLLPEGAVMHQPELVTSLEQLARAGVEDFYDGELARALAEGFARLGNGLTLKDLEQTKAVHSEALSIRYRAGTLFNFPPPTQGLYTLKALNALNLLALEDFENGGSDYYHFLVEAIKRQLKIRNRELCDPAMGTLNTGASLSQTRAAADFAAIEADYAQPWLETGRPADTVWFAASDRHGRTACLMQSLFHDFGSGCAVGNTGILWLNRAAGFSANQRHDNAWAPGKRPAHTLNPSCYLADDGRQFYFGSQGGDGQPQTQMVLATQLVDYRQPIESALLAPRFLQGRSFFDSTESLKLERSIGPSVADGLTRRGHDIEWIPELSPYTGQAGILSISADGFKEAMHDPRGQGNALGQP